MSASESDFLLSLMKPMAIFSISVVGFILVFRNKSKRRPVDFYTNPGTFAYLISAGQGSPDSTIGGGDKRIGFLSK